MTPPRLDLRKGVTDPVVLLISRRQVEQQDLASVLDSLKVFTATREVAWLYRGQMSLVVDGYNHDPRELVDIPEVRHFLKRLAAQWPYLGFFLNQVDDSIKILGSCCCGVEFPGRGAVLIDPALLPGFLNQAFAGMNALFDQHGFPEHELEAMSMGLVALTAPSDKWVFCQKLLYNSDKLRPTHESTCASCFVSRPIPARGGLAFAQGISSLGDSGCH